MSSTSQSMQQIAWNAKNFANAIRELVRNTKFQFNFFLAFSQLKV